MKTKIETKKILLMFMIFIVALTCITSCKNKNDDNINPINDETNDPGITSETVMEVKYQSSLIYVGESITMKVELTPTTNKVYSAFWTSDNEKIASVNNGVVVGIAAGFANITVKMESLEKTIEVEVIEKEQSTYVNTTDIIVNTTNSIINIGESTYVVSSVIPSNATLQELFYTSSDESIATVDEKGKVTGVEVGKVTISITNQEMTKTIELEVIDNLVNKEITIDKQALLVGETTTIIYDNQTSQIDYKLSEENIITIDNNLITAINLGLVELEITYENEKYVFTIIVSDVNNQTNPVIVLKDDHIDVSYNNGEITVDNCIVTITGSGSYYLYGQLLDGQIKVLVTKEDKVYLYLNGVNITCNISAPIYSAASDKTFIILGENTTNKLTDCSNYVYEDGETEPNACLFSKDDLTIKGPGSLIVESYYNNGIGTKDDLKISNANITVVAINNALKGNESIEISNSVLNLSSSSDGIKSEEIEEEGKGYIEISDSKINMTTVNDGIQAATYLTISNSEVNLTTGKGSSYSVTTTSGSMKGIKAEGLITIESGTFTINSQDDAIHSNNSIVINNGTFTLASGDDGIHADDTITINNGNFNITKSYEGIEAVTINLNGGIVKLNATDDGINSAGGDGSSTSTSRPGGPGGMFGGGMTIGNGMININGGSYYLTASGDGIDANGSIKMTGGNVYVNGPTSNGNGALDYDGTFVITGGELLAVGSQGMMQTISNTSTQYCLVATFNSVSANTLLHIVDKDGNAIITYQPNKSYQSIIYCSSKITKGMTYQIYLGGSYSNGQNIEGLYENGTYNKGNLIASLTVNAIVTGGSSGRPR